MFKVFHKNEQREYEVYNIRDDKTGYPHFLIFQEGRWVYQSAKHFVPTTNQIIGNMPPTNFNDYTTLINDNKPNINNIPTCCQRCSNHPSNGGSGVCHCTLPYMESSKSSQSYHTVTTNII